MNHKLSVLAVALAVTLPASAFAATNTTTSSSSWMSNTWNSMGETMGNPYLQVAGGLNWDMDSNQKSATAVRETEFNTGWATTAAIGYKLKYGFRSELEGGYRWNHIEDVHGAIGRDGAGNVSSYSAMLNLLYDFDNQTRFTPYLGAGAGVIWLSYNDVTPAPTGVTVANQKDRLLPAVQGIAGVDYKLTNNLSTFLNYQYLTSFNEHVNNTAGTKLDVDYDNSTVLLGVKYTFGAPKQMAHREYVSDSRTTVKSVQTDANSYLVFFDFNSTELTADAQRILQTAVDNANRRGVTRIVVTGHADRAGSDAYNMKLSKRRAETVKAALLRMGLSASDVATVAKGEREPLVATADGVREPQNRRVEIVYGGK